MLLESGEIAFWTIASHLYCSDCFPLQFWRQGWITISHCLQCKASFCSFSYHWHCTAYTGRWNALKDTKSHGMLLLCLFSVMEKRMQDCPLDESKNTHLLHFQEFRLWMFLLIGCTTFYLPSGWSKKRMQDCPLDAGPMVIFLFFGFFFSSFFDQ